MEELLASLPEQNLTLAHGQEVEAEVVLINDKEIILDLNLKLDGVIPLKDLGTKDLKVGDKIKAFVVEPENESGQVTLSLGKTKPQGVKQATTIDPKIWEGLVKKQATEEVIKGVVTKVTQFGVFIKLEEGVEGLIHSSKLGENKFEIGQDMSVIIDSLDGDKKRISLTPVITSTKGLMYK